MYNFWRILLLALIYQLSYADDVSSILDWHTDPTNSCQGYYTEPVFAAPSSKKQTDIDADLVTAPLKGDWLLDGHVHLYEDQFTLNADHAILSLNEKTKKRSLVTAKQHIRLRQPGTLLTGSKGHFNLDKKTGDIEQGLYRVSLSPISYQTQGQQQKILSRSGWGHAQQLQQFSPEHFRGHQATYSTCPPNSSAWIVKASEVNVYHDEGIGTARHARLYLWGVPIFYSPYLSFPINDERKSGILTPTMGTSSTNGFSFTLPMYLNLAPNYDDLVTVHMMRNRGVQLTNEFRYLTTTSNGNFSVDVLPHDSEFANFQRQATTTYAGNQFLPDLLAADSQRFYVKFNHHTQFTPQLTADLNYNWSSDNYFVNDLITSSTLGGDNTVTSQLTQSAKVNYANDSLNLTGSITRYQTLQQVSQNTFARPYDQMPRITLNYHPYISNLIKPSLALDYTSFTLSPDLNDRITSDRLYLVPNIKLPWHNDYAYLTPSIKLHLSHYRLYPIQANQPGSINRTLPITSIDSGLFFDRDFSMIHHHYRQTLEPRLFFVYIPFREQGNIPIFDTSRFTYYYPQLFEENRFSGFDRIGDTRQVTLGVTSRILEAGQEKARFSIGQIFYTGNQRVELCTSLGCTNSNISLLGEKSGITRSIIASELRLHPLPNWTGSANFSYNPESKKIINRSYQLSYQSDNRHIINLNYSFTQNIENWLYLNKQDSKNTRIIGGSGVWPLTQDWLLTGSIQKDLERNFIQDYLVGIEYNSCCWAFRVVTGRLFVRLENEKPIYNKGIFLQWQFKGLGTFGNADPANMLKRHIEHYNGQLTDE